MPGFIEGEQEVRSHETNCSEEVRNQVPLQQVRPELLHAAHWRAARYGISDGLIDVVGYRLRSAAEIIETMLGTLRPTLEEKGNWEEIAELVHQTVRQGNGSMRQCAIYQQDERMEDLVQYMVTETSKGIS